VSATGREGCSKYAGIKYEVSMKHGRYIMICTHFSAHSINDWLILSDLLHSS